MPKHTEQQRKKGTEYIEISISSTSYFGPDASKPTGKHEKKPYKRISWYLLSKNSNSRLSSKSANVGVHLQYWPQCKLFSDGATSHFAVGNKSFE
jgi:hypothetical protein